jgi:hypothetical protein
MILKNSIGEEVTIPLRPIPLWWADYKKRNPDDLDDYNPRHHCCRTFYKDYCECPRTPRYLRNIRPDETAESTLEFLNDNKVEYKFTDEKDIVKVYMGEKEVSLTLTRRQGAFTCRYEGSDKTYAYYKKGFLKKANKDAS